MKGGNSFPATSSSSPLYLSSTVVAAAAAATAAGVAITIIVVRRKKKDSALLSSNGSNGNDESNAATGDSTSNAMHNKSRERPIHFPGPQTPLQKLNSNLMQLSTTTVADWGVTLEVIEGGRCEVVAQLRDAASAGLKSYGSTCNGSAAAAGGGGGGGGGALLRSISDCVSCAWLRRGGSGGDSGGSGGGGSDGDLCQPTRFSFDVEMVEGVPMPPFIPQRRFDKLRNNLLLRSGDIIVCTYPKCGTTWAEQIVLLLLHGGDASILNPSAKNSFRPGGVGKVWPEVALMNDTTEEEERHLREIGGFPIPKLVFGESLPISMEDFENIPGRRVIKSHAPPHLVVGLGPARMELAAKELPRLPQGVKAIAVTRNAKDACVSSFYHAHNPAKRGWPFPVWAAMYLKGYVPCGPWLEHTKAWIKAGETYPDDVLVLSYEAIKAKPLEQVRIIADFLGLQADDKLLQKCVAASSFDFMKALAKDAQHLRKGVVGDWERHMSVAVAKEFDEHFSL